MALFDNKITEILQHPSLDIPAPPDPSSFVHHMEIFLDILAKWNARINLTSEKQPERILERHVFDSLQYARALKPGQKVLDIGSGAGFPGFPLKFLYPDLDLFLVESQKKRCNFLQTVVRELDLIKITVVESRAEKLAQDTTIAGTFDTVILRAVGDLDYCLNLGEPFLKPDGRLAVKKGTGEPINLDPSSSQWSLKENFPIKGWGGELSALLVFAR